MTLQEIIHKILNIAKLQPNVNYVGEGDIYELNSNPNIDYSVFFITQTNHRTSFDTVTYNLTLYYIDRLTNNGSNRLQIQSQGIQELNNILNIAVDELNVDIEDVTYTTFTHKFTDDCAGVFATVAITTKNDLGGCGYGSIQE